MELIKYTFRALLVYGFLTILFLAVSLHYTGYFHTKSEPRVWYPNMKNLVVDIDKFFWTELNFSEILIETDNSTTISTTLNKRTNVRKGLQYDIILTSETNSFCPEKPPKLQGWISAPDKWKSEPPTFDELHKQRDSQVEIGNFTYSPIDCAPRYTVAIIIPFRGRETQLRWFVSHMHKIWQKQQIRYTLYIITQAGKQLFNRAKLMNVGFTEAVKDYRYDCYVYHDVDLLLENDRCLYWCSKNNDVWTNPRHLSTYIDKFNYNVHTYSLGMCSPMSYKNMEIELFGGATMFTEDQFLAINGFSNVYWGWGAEDDDLFIRTRHKGYRVDHENSHYCSYHMIDHTHERRNKKNLLRYLLLKHAISRQANDGLSNLRYNELSRDRTSLFVNITVDIGRPSRKLRELLKTFNDNEDEIGNLSCFRSLIWMYNKFINIYLLFFRHIFGPKQVL